MPKIEESLKRLSVENETTNHKSQKNGFCVGELSSKVEEIAAGDDNYILALCGTQNEPDFRVAAALSNRECVIYSVGESLSKTRTLSHCESPIIGIKFSPVSKNIIYIASNDGKVTACDLRAKDKVIAEFKDDSTGKLRPLVSFDVSNDERLLAGGTEHIGGDAFILFWDLRSNSKINQSNNLLGGYWESHVDDITSLSFHPSKKDTLASGGIDGLINIYDLVQPSEDAALTYSLNTESSVDSIGWLGDENLWCTAHTELQLWNEDGATPYAKFDRQSLAPIGNPDNCYLVKMHASSAFGEPFLLMGSTQCNALKCASVGDNHAEFIYTAVENKQIVRDSWIHEKSASLVTGGELGIINIWKKSESATTKPPASQKSVSKLTNGKGRDKHRSKPYSCKNTA